ncbi:MAG TPA: hypothetical protein VIB48_10545 [Acidimicrobiia bacterium]|jgi:hypothetical protein
MRIGADELCPGDRVRWGDHDYTVERVRSDGSLRHLRTAEGLCLVFHALEQVEVTERHRSCAAA